VVRCPVIGLIGDAGAEIVVSKNDGSFGPTKLGRDVSSFVGGNCLIWSAEIEMINKKFEKLFKNIFLVLSLSPTILVNLMKK
jgi:hypothetical protein